MQQRISADIFRQGRRAKRLNQLDIAKALGVSRVYVCRLEKGVARPSLEKIQQLNQMLNLDLTQTEMLELYRTWGDPGRLTHEEDKLIRAYRSKDFAGMMRIISSLMEPPRS